MVIEAKHFDTRLNQWIHTDNNPSNPDSLLKEELTNSLLEYFFPNVEFSFGHMDEKATADQLKNHPEGHKLLLSSKSRLLYGPEECLETISKLCPDSKDRGAYGSIFLGSCKNAIAAELNVLVVDDSTGENGGIIDNNQAYRLTGDCYGQISTELYHQLTGHQEGNQYRVIQHRFGWTDKDGEDGKFRFGKGTLRPANLDHILNYQDPNNQAKVDLILPLSAFKGTDKDNLNGPSKPQIKTGLYRQKIWLGEKSQSELGKTAISQMIASFPNGLKDFAETVELEAAKLKEALADPRKIAQLYCEKYEKRKAFLEQQAAQLEEEATINPEVTEEFEKLQERLATDTSIYKLIKKDLEGSGQLLETEKIQRELARFVQGEWQDISVGKTLTFERAMVIPSKNLRDGEVCIPHYQDGEEVLNFRSPFLNSNGLCVSTNKIVEDILGPDGKPLAGVIAVSDETSDRIYNRLNKQLLSILLEAQGKNIQLEGIENYLDKNIGKLGTKDKIEFINKFNEYIQKLQSAGYELEILPQESEQERQARDYDGDCIGFEQASKYPNLTAEALERNLPENAYDPTVKLKKQSFYQEDGSQPEFEEIAIHMSDGISVGIINNHLTSIEALESEITILKKFGSEKEQIEYVQQVAKHYEDLFKTEAWAKSKGIEGKEVPDKYRASLEEFVQTVRQEPLTQATALFAMGINTRMYREMIAEAAFQNQIAVDLFKSANKPEIEIIRNNSQILHREVNYIRDKKKDFYLDSTIKPTGNSPVEILISKVNQYFEKAQLESRELAQFSNLFKGVEFTYEQRLQANLAKREFDREFNNATRYSQRKKVEKGPSASIDIGNGKKLDVTNLLRYDHPLIWNAQKITLKVSEIPAEKCSKDKPHRYRVYAQINDETENGKPKFRTLGTVSKEQEAKLQELGITPNQEITSTKISFQPELSEGQIKLMYQKAYQIAEDFYNSIPDDQKLRMAAATWAVSTTRETSNSRGQSEIEQEVERQKKVSNFVFATFIDKIIKQIYTLQFTGFTLTGYNRTSEIIKPENQGQLQEIRFNISEQVDNKGNTVIKDVIEVKNPETGDYETFANINATDGKLHIGTTATGTIEKGEVYTATVTAKIPGLPEVSFEVKELQKFQYKDQRFNGEQVNLTIVQGKLEREDYVITFQNGSKEEKLGTLSKESVKVGIEAGWLAEKPGQKGQQLKLKITSITTGKNAFAIGETPEGKLVRIEIDDKFKDKEFISQELSINIKAYDKLCYYTAKIGDKSLGIIGQYSERVYKGKSKYNKTPSVPEQLIRAGIINENKVQTTIPVVITSNATTCKLTINPESVQYPENWIKRYQLVEQQKEVSPVEQKNSQLFDKIIERPTLMFQSQEDKLVGLIGLAVDSKKAEVTKEFLQRVGITYEQLPKSESRLEIKKGMTVFMLDESTIPPEIKEQFIERVGGIKSNVTPPLTAPIIPEQTIYFSNPNQQYTLEDNSQVIKEAIGLVAPVQDVGAINYWLESKGANSNYIIEEDSSIAIFILEKDTVSSELEENLNTLLGEAINIGEVDGFDQYEQLSNELYQKVKEQGSLLEISSTPQQSEYRQVLQSLPNRPKLLSQEEIPLPIAPAKPAGIEENNTQNLQLPVDKSFNYNLDKQATASNIRNAIASASNPNSPLTQSTQNTQTWTAQPIRQESIEGKVAAQPIVLPSTQEADHTKPIEIMGVITSEKVEQLRSHLETYIKPVLETDKSNYAPGRQVAWVGAKWDLKDKDFKSGVQDDNLMQLVKQVYPDADIVLVTYSEQPGAGINYHRDDSYAATEARSINIGNSEWGYRAAKEQMAWTREENKNATYQEFKLESGTVTRFNCKNEHAAINTEAKRWSINIWSIKNDLGRENSVRQKFENFLASNQPPRAVINSNDDLTIKSNEWIPGGEIKVERSYTDLKDATRNAPLPNTPKQPIVEELIAIGNQTAARAQNPQIPENPTISGKPVPMVYSLHTHGEPDKVPVNTTIDAMRGYGRIHTTRGVDYQKTYGIKEGDIAIALGKNGEQVAFRVGKQYEITPQMIQNPAYTKAWANWEKHSVKELTQTQASKSKIYGLFMEPLGDYVNDKIVPFPTVQKQTATPINVSPDSNDGLGAALANATALAKEQGKLQNDYQVSFNNNPEAAAGRYGVETHFQKPEGLAYASAEHAFNHQKQLNPSADEYKLMVEVLQAKLEQHPRLIEAIAKRGGTKWLENCTAVATTGGFGAPTEWGWGETPLTGSAVPTLREGVPPTTGETPATHCLTSITNAQDKQWEGKGKESAFIRALSEAYANIIEKFNVQTATQPTQESIASTVTPKEIQPEVNTIAERGKKPITVISGGQTGADMGGLIGAALLGLPTGGTAAAEWVTENGANPNLQKYGLIEGEKGSSAVETYNKRTIKNIRNSDGTAIFGNINSPGSRFTAKVVQDMGKPILHVPTETALNDKPTAARQLRDFVEKNNIQTLNISGNRESKAPGLQAAVAEIVQIGLAYQKNQDNSQDVPTCPTPTILQSKTIAPGINLSSRSPDPLGGALTSTTVKSKQIGTTDKEYPVSFRDNKAMPVGNYGLETYTKSKEEGQPFLSAEQAFYAYKETLPLGEPRVQLMAEILQTRFEQYPELTEAVTQRGGVEWLKQCSYLVSSETKNFWEGKELESAYIRALTQGYTKALENINSQVVENQSAEAIQLTSNQAPQPTPKETEQTSFTLKNQTQSPQTLNADIQQSLSLTPVNSHTSSIDKTLNTIKQSTIQNLQNWYEAAKKLGRTEKYINRIQEVTNQYKTDSSYNLEKAFKAMSRDIRELQQINEITKLAQKVAKTLGQEDVNGIMSVKTESYKNYQIATKAQEQTYLIKDKDNNVLLYIRENKIQVNNLNEEVINDFRFMYFQIENSLQDVKKELIER
ncbi:putative molybdenum carrier protein [Chlorogloeopsis sp. ULAP01]|uniref:YpsA SLOG family protein n=1 Tax=Chlorogloeopsis sp. ULAP01 TaxID=3056483 RepID=UPI0025AC48F2|nr:putative molybdenum carrier protein [Chlorogloeopsis sp. ULAP01]